VGLRSPAALETSSPYLRAPGAAGGGAGCMVKILDGGGPKFFKRAYFWGENRRAIFFFLKNIL
jgi:hypothetical protein